MFKILAILFYLFKELRAFDPTQYKCSLCVSVLEHVKSTDIIESKGYSFLSVCKGVFPADVCNTAFTIFKKNPILNDLDFIHSHTSRDSCERALICPFELIPDISSNSLDIRVSKALGSKGYNKVRLSVISNSSINSEFFTYSSQFKYRWTSNYLNTGVISITPGEKNVLSINGQNVELFIPKQNDGIRGVIIADPCFQSQWITCLYKDKFNTFNHTIELLNAINSWDDTHFWQILGDNFYDQSGDPTKSWFQALSQKSKSKVFATTPG